MQYFPILVLYLVWPFLYCKKPASTPQEQARPELVWSDEFNGSALNTADWNYETGGGSGF